jgi:hypothetical protein
MPASSRVLLMTKVAGTSAALPSAAGRSAAVAHELGGADVGGLRSPAPRASRVEQRLGSRNRCGSRARRPGRRARRRFAARDHDAAFLRGDDARRTRPVRRLSKTTASFRNGPIRCSGIEAMAPLSSSSLRTRGDSLTVLVGPRRAPACWPHAAWRGRRLVQHQHLARVDQVRVADLVAGSCPTARASARALQEQLGDVPQRVAALHGVRIGRVGRQVGQRHAGLRDLLAVAR